MLSHTTYSVLSCSIEETWAAWQDFHDQCHIVEIWLSDTEESLAKSSQEVRLPGEDVHIQVIASFVFIAFYFSVETL